MMRKLWVLIIFGFILCMGNSCKSKHIVAKSVGMEDLGPEADTDEVMTLGVDEIAVFLHGTPQQWVAKNVKYPQEAVKKRIRGKVYVEFIIDKQGKVTEPRVLRGSGSYLLDSAAIEVIAKMPAWRPAKQRGKRVRMSYTLPISFGLR